MTKPVDYVDSGNDFEDDMKSDIKDDMTYESFDNSSVQLMNKLTGPLPKYSLLMGKCDSCDAPEEEYEHSGCCPRGNNQCPHYPGRQLDLGIN